MEIAALPSCEKSLFAGAKVAFFLKNESHRHSMPIPRQSVTGPPGCNHFDIRGIYRIKLRITLPDSYKLFLYSLGVTPFIRKKKRPKVVESA